MPANPRWVYFLYYLLYVVNVEEDCFIVSLFECVFFLCEQKADPVVYPLSVSLEDLYSGTVKKVRVNLCYKSRQLLSGIDCCKSWLMLYD
jgi:hypothetical protein